MTVAAPPRWEVLYAEAHVERFRYLARAGCADVRRETGALAVARGVWSNTDNGIVLEREDLAPDAVRDLVRWFRVPASLVCCGFDASDELCARLAGTGLREEASGVTTGADLGALDLPPPAVPEGISISEVTTAEDLEDWLAVARATGICHELDRRPLPVRHWVARRGRVSVGLATAFFAGETVLLEHVAVLEEERRSGIATALALVRLHEARRLACRLAVFGTTPESATLYERFGFTTQPDAGRRWFYLPLEP
jgi:GNAT superfamily N-acetyltransferase